MDAKIVVGVGKLSMPMRRFFMAGIHPKRLAYRISQSRLEKFISSDSIRIE